HPLVLHSFPTRRSSDLGFLKEGYSAGCQRIGHTQAQGIGAKRAQLFIPRHKILRITKRKKVTVKIRSRLFIVTVLDLEQPLVTEIGRAQSELQSREKLV